MTNQAEFHYTNDVLLLDDLAALLGKTKRAVFNDRNKGKIPPPDGRLPHSSAYYWHRETIAHLAKGGDV